MFTPAVDTVEMYVSFIGWDAGVCPMRWRALCQLPSMNFDAEHAPDTPASMLKSTSMTSNAPRNGRAATSGEPASVVPPPGREDEKTVRTPTVGVRG